MYFESCKSMLYSDTLLPDIFVTEYMPSMDGDCVKVYIHCMFLSKFNKKASIEDLSKKLGIVIEKVKTSLAYLNSLGIIAWSDDNIVLNDLKEIEINKLYRFKTTSSPDEAILSSERNKKRNVIISTISNTFFQGMMPPSWYTDIDAWFDRYKFEEDVMYALFQHCYDHKGLAKNYIIKVADNWKSKNIINSFDLDSHFMEYQKVKDIRKDILKKLNLKRLLTEYEDEYIEKWVTGYKFDFSIIDLSLRKTTAKTNPNFEYINKILVDWHGKGFKTAEEIIDYEKSQKQVPGKSKAKSPVIPQKGNFEQRKYDDDYYNSLYENFDNAK